MLYKARGSIYAAETGRLRWTVAADRADKLCGRVPRPTPRACTWAAFRTGAPRRSPWPTTIPSASDEADYGAVPYWGYEPDSAWSEEAGGFTWDFSDYYKDRFAGPFAQLVVASDNVHRPRPDEARLAWRFLSRFARVGGKAVEL